MSDAWFEALGEPVPERRREAATEAAIDMGVTLDDSTVRAWIDTIAGKVERDQPDEAMDRARRHLDVTGMYRLLAYLCVSSVRETEDELDVLSRTSTSTEYEYRVEVLEDAVALDARVAMSDPPDDLPTIDIPDDARGVSLETFGDDVWVRYLVPVDGGDA